MNNGVALSLVNRPGQSAMNFEFDAQYYQRASTHQQEWGQRLIAELGLQGHERILDVGSGDGSLTRKLAASVPRGSVLGLDASTQMIEAAQRLQEPNLRFVRMDIVDGDFREEFDVVFSSATLHWVKDHRRLLGVLYRALKPGGVVRLSFGGQGNCSRLIATLQELMAEPPYQRAFSGFVWPWYMPAVESYERLVREVPFSNARVWGEVADRHFPSVGAMIGWIDQPSLVPFRQHLDAATGERFREEVIARMTGRTREADGRCFETFRRINVLARK
jgi:trans-aconitate 2-methyltransferase